MRNQPTRKHGSPAIFLDRDGVIIRYERLLHERDKLEILPGVPEALAKLRAAGYLLVIASNQPVVARGLISEDDLRALHDALRAMLRERGTDVDAIYYCPHHPEATLPAYRRECMCRKPKTGMIEQAAAELDIDLTRSILIGDELRDIQAGYTAGLMTILIRPCDGSHPHEAFPAEPDAIAGDLTAAAELVFTGALFRHAR